MPTWAVYPESSADASDRVNDDLLQTVAFEGDEQLGLQSGAGGMRAAKVPEAFLTYGEDDRSRRWVGFRQESLRHVERDGDRGGIVAHTRPDKRRIVLTDLQRSVFVEDRVDMSGHDESRPAATPLPNEVAGFIAPSPPCLIANPFADPGEPRLLGKGRPWDSCDIDYVIDESRHARLWKVEHAGSS
jgi:hypothetical protein